MYIDNLTYGASIEGKVNKRITEDKMETTNMTLYELPVKSTLQSQNGHSVTELDGSTYVTCYGKIDHLQFFIKTEFLAWIDSPMCAESNGASFMKKY